jgi:hypothetical protein
MGKPWFVVKRYGIGAAPNGLCGWLFTIGFAVVLVLGAVWAERGGSKVAAAFALPVLAIVFIAVAKLKSDKAWRWRWGQDDR